jgi:ribosomal protein S12 methylthiotransferase accessory factor
VTVGIEAGKLIRRAAGQRHGIVMPPRIVAKTAAELPGVSNAVVMAGPFDAQQRAGGAGRSTDDAELAAIGEALEHYAARACTLRAVPESEIDGERIELAEFSLHSVEQRSRPDFPHRDFYAEPPLFTRCWSPLDNRPAWLPATLVGMSPGGAGVTTSSGLAAATSPHAALLRAMQEIVERDALMITWLHGVPGRRVNLGPAYDDAVRERGGEVVCFDATPDFSPHPVALVLGQLPARGRPRYALGAACRETWVGAVEKAYLEWAQGVTFAGYRLKTSEGLAYESPLDVRTFDDHATYYTLRPDEWKRLPIHGGEPYERRPSTSAAGKPGDEITRLARALREAGVRVYYRELTTRDLRQVGVHVVRALSPDLVPIFDDQRWPLLGGSAANVTARYSWAAGLRLSFPSPFPHPLG